MNYTWHTHKCADNYWEIHNEKGEVEVGISSNDKEAERTANLIAAAPEMYEALKDIAEMKVMPVSYIESAKSIVAKAEGGK